MPPDVREEPGQALDVHSPKAASIVLPNKGVEENLYLQCLTTLASTPGRNLGFLI